MNKIETSDIAKLPTKFGNFLVKAYKEGIQEHLAIMSENFFDLQEPLLRIHSECLTGDTLGSLKCDCQDQLHAALNMIAKDGGFIIYHRQEGRNIGLLNKIKAYCLQDGGLNTVEANLALGFKDDERTYDVVGFILKDLNIKSVKLITNNPKKLAFFDGLDVKITQRVALTTEATEQNKEYLDVKKNKMGHMFK